MNRRVRVSDINPTVLAAAGVNAGQEKPSKAKLIAQKFADQVQERMLPDPEREYLFASQLGRRWRFDFAWPDRLIALEIEGLVVMRINGQLQVMGRHASITGFKEDCEKYAWAAVLGWRVLRFEQSQVKSKLAIDMLVRVLANAPRVAPAPPKQQGFELAPAPTPARSPAPF
jgi:very-short-patch-repair endonuclease